MKILGIVCSPRKGGNTEILVKEALTAAKEKGGETELFLVAGKTITPCDGCLACADSGICKIDDDMQELYQKLEQADGVIFGTPVYFLNVSAQAKAIIDRSTALYNTKKLRGKVAAAIVVANRVGNGQVLSLLYTYFVAQRMMIAGGGIGYGREKGEVIQSLGSSSRPALEEARAVGKSVVSMIERFSRRRF